MSKATEAHKLLRYVASARSRIPLDEVAGAYRGPGLVRLYESSLRMPGVCGYRPDPAGEEFIATQGLVAGDCEDLNGVQLGRLAALGSVPFETVVLDGSRGGHLVLIAEGLVLDGFAGDRETLVLGRL